MNVEEKSFYFNVLTWLIMALIGVYTWIVQRASARNAEVLELRERVVKLEVEIKNMPSEATVRELIGQLQKLAAHSEYTERSLETLQHTVNRINDYLMDQK